MTVSLVRHRDFSQVGELEPETGELRIIHRTRSDTAPYWLPEVPMHGWFDEIGGKLVLLYRNPAEDQVLWFQLDRFRSPLSGELRSEFAPDLENGEPLLENADVLRVFSLFRNDSLVARHAYQLNDRAQRLEGAMDPFPNWPDEEADYDLLFFVHRILVEERWPRVLR